MGVPSIVTYQHRAKYMCSLTKTDPERRMYQHVAMLSGLEHSIKMALV